MGKDTLGDCLLIGETAVIGAAEMAHLAAMMLKLPFGTCALLFAGLSGCALLAGVAVLFAGRRALPGDAVPWQGTSAGWRKSAGMQERLLWAAFVAAAASQLIFIAMGHTVYRQGDMTAETVESFLASDGIYRVNPMTGMPYREGMPLRLKILCLPTLYGSLCRLTGLEPVTVVQRIVPVLVLLSSYVAFGLAGRALFPADGRKRACFLLFVALLLWAGAYGEGMDGFGLLCGGWRGTSIRNGVLLPWLFSLCLRGRWPETVLCVLAECCMVWTLYGLGVCALVVAGMLVASFWVRRSSGISGASGMLEERAGIWGRFVKKPAGGGSGEGAG